MTSEQIAITGGAGFLGARMARELLARGDQRRLLLIDRMPPPADLAAHPQVSSLVGDLNDLLANPAQAQLALHANTVAVVHLAAAVSAECEADFDLGMRSNAQATLGLLQAARALKTQPVFLYASSLAVFGFGAGLPRPAVIDDFSLPTPQGSYGIQKFVGEQWVADFSRKGFVRGRSVRPMTVSVRPGKPNGAASGFLSGMVREPLAGLRATVPVGPQTAVALASPANTVNGLIRALNATDAEWGPHTAMNLPSIATTVHDMAEALRRVGGDSAYGLLDWQPNKAIERLVGSWPSVLRFDRAQALGLQADVSFEAIVRAHVADMAGLAA